MDTTSKGPLKNANAGHNRNTCNDRNRISTIYMSIDHLKKGTYSLSILENEKVIKTIKIKKL